MNDEKKIAATTGGAVSISLFASFVGLCCIGPWAVVLFGVSGAVTMARWAPYRPYIISVAAIMLAWAFWRVYRPQPWQLPHGAIHMVKNHALGRGRNDRSCIFCG
jgi:hypothetical protein